MPVLNYNVSWMVYNSFLALLAVGFGYFIFEVENKIIRFIIGICWFLFLPNTIYIFTDLMHLIEQWYYTQGIFHFLLLLQYAVFEIIGIVTFLLAFFPIEKIVDSIKILKKNKTFVFIIFNLIIAFGMVLGRVERINSWDLFTNPRVVIISGLHVFTSINLLVLTLLFGLICNFIYFLSRDRVFVTLRKKYLH